ncbi:MAG TPA: glyoxalase superfamily protein [Chitinophagaceae bacterium]|nr:glyoxalase superfamily protein [Chitinophagaceae bacterium]
MNIRVENITPILYVSDMARSLAFYVNVLGFENAEWGDENFTSIDLNGKGLYLCKGGQGSPDTWVWIGFNGSIFSLYKELQSKGVNVKMPPTKFSWAYELQVEDPDGHILRFGTNPDDREQANLYL